MSLSLTLLTAPLALCRLDAASPVPEWTARAHGFLSITRTSDELSIVVDESAVPASVQAKRGYRALRVDGVLDLSLIGIVASLAAPLAAAEVPIFPIATYDTDYILVPGSAVTAAITALEGAGHRVVTAQQRG